MYEINIQLYGHKNTCSFYTAVKFNQKRDTGLINSENSNAVSR